MTEETKQIILTIVYQGCAEDPSIVSDVISSASAGVKEYASNQSEKANKLAFMMIDMLEDNKLENFGHFTKNQVFDMMGNYFEGTPGLKKLKEKYEIK